VKAGGIAIGSILATVVAVHAAGNVTVDVDAGRVAADGDDAPNAILVTAGPDPDGILIAGLDGTTVNGAPDFAATGVRRLDIVTGRGADRVELRQLRIRGAVHLRLGRGDDVVIAEQVTARRLDVRTGAGNDAVTVGPQTRIRGLVNVHTGRDRDSVVLQSSNLSAIAVATGPGDDVLDVFDTRVAGRTRVFTNTGQDVVVLALTEFVGDFDLNLGDDDDVLRLDAVVFDDDSDLDGGDDDDFLILDGPVDFDESPRVDDFE